MGIVLSLLFVGVLSKTPIRHVIQIAPTALALVPVIRKRPWASYAALPVYGFWLFIMVLIWLWLTGISAITTGNFTVAEVVLTVLIGASCIMGIVAWYRTAAPANAWLKAGVFALFLTLQIAAMWLSLQPAFEAK